MLRCFRPQGPGSWELEASWQVEAGDPKLAEQAVRHVLTNSKRGHEEALRLARSMKLNAFADEALAIALSNERDQVLRQTALGYLQLAPGKVRARPFARSAFRCS